MLKLLIIPHEKNNFSPYLLRKVAILFYTCILVVVNVLPGLIPGFMPEVVAKASADSINTEKLIALTNEERRKYGLNELDTNIYLTTAAYAKANDMLEYQYWDHFGPDSIKNSPWYFIKSTSYNYIYAGENLAKGFKTSEGVHQAWMASPTHRENILSGNYKDIGIAVVYGNLQGEDVVLVVQMFGNLTAQTEQTSVPEDITYPVGTEEGEIKSIKITYPEQSSIIKDQTINVEGAIEGSISSYQLFLYENESEIANFEESDRNWAYGSSKSWSEGDHTISAKVQSENQEMMTETSFTVDSTPPAPMENSLKVELLGGDWLINLILDDPNGKASIVSGNNSFDMTLSESGVFETFIPMEDVEETVSLLISDEVGNINEIDITDEFIGVDEGTVLGILTSNINTKDVINASLGLFVFSLLVIELYYYRKLGKLAERANSLMFVGLWLVIILFTIFEGFSGEIIA